MSAGVATGGNDSYSLGYSILVRAGGMGLPARPYDLRDVVQRYGATDVGTRHCAAKIRSSMPQ
jgi:hypothetical protein